MAELSNTGTLDITNFVSVNDSQSILYEIPCVNSSVGNPFDCLTDHRS